MFNYSQAVEIIEGMRGHYDSGFSSMERTNIERLHQQIFGKGVKRLGCKSCYQDGYLLIRSYLKKNQTIPMPKYELKPGVVIHEFGSKDYYTNAIPEEIALDYLRKDESRISNFRRYPSDWRNELRTEKVAEETTVVEKQTEATVNPEHKKNKKRKH